MVTSLYKTGCFNSKLPGSRDEGMCEMKLWCQPRDFESLLFFSLQVFISVGPH